MTEEKTTKPIPRWLAIVVALAAVIYPLFQHSDGNGGGAKGKNTTVTNIIYFPDTTKKGKSDKKTVSTKNTALDTSTNTNVHNNDSVKYLYIRSHFRAPMKVTIDGNFKGWLYNYFDKTNSNQLLIEKTVGKCEICYEMYREGNIHCDTLSISNLREGITLQPPFGEGKAEITLLTLKKKISWYSYLQRIDQPQDYIVATDMDSESSTFLIDEGVYVCHVMRKRLNLLKKNEYTSDTIKIFEGESLPFFVEDIVK